LTNETVMPGEPAHAVPAPPPDNQLPLFTGLDPIVVIPENPQ